MNFVDTALFQVIWKGAAALIFFFLIRRLIDSAGASWKKSKGSIISVLDEVVLAIVYIAIFGIIVYLPPSTIINVFTAIVGWIWGFIHPILRDYIGIPI
ncbi:hypothetical protein [Breznakia pachnodae]|uniref:Membrane-anchored protein n=1 Tax=Breznakia pachnodae TaxID=265178 RepID=A0ABU0E6D9_9FIRM|nr:hypothetical protein [Breznakia pachnodae]MDQ0362474.1 putative membrane-anchored protein [Breznakia pachnodae]